MWIKQILLFLLALLLIVPTVNAIEECENEITPGDSPCMVISSWQYLESCDTHNVSIWNSTPVNLVNRSMGDYGISGRCNVTFNYTQIGSYLLNFTSGDSATIVVEGDEMSYVAIGLIMVGVTLLFVILAIKAKVMMLQLAFTMISIMMVVWDFFIAARIMEATNPNEVGIISNLYTFYDIGLTIQWIMIWGVLIYILIMLANFFASLDKKKKAEREELYR